MPIQTEQLSERETASPNFTNAEKIHYPETVIEEIKYPSSDGEEMGETTIHYKLIHYLFGCLMSFLAARNNVFLGANLMLYYEQDNPRTYYVPDLMVAFGVDNKNRSSYRAWEEKQFPQIVIEVASENTYENDLGKKRRDYERLGVEEYYLLDPEGEFLPSKMMAFHRVDDRLKLISITEERVFSPRLQLEFVNTNNEIRLFNQASNEFLRTLEEAETENARLRAELAKLKQIN